MSDAQHDLESMQDRNRRPVRADITSKEVAAALEEIRTALSRQDRENSALAGVMEKFARIRPVSDYDVPGIKTTLTAQSAALGRYTSALTAAIEALQSPSTSSSVEMVAIPRSVAEEWLDLRDRIHALWLRHEDDKIRELESEEEAKTKALATALKGQTPVQETSLFPRVWTYIRDHGKADPPPAIRVGGIWSADIHRLGKAVAGLYSDGSERRITAPGLDVWEDYHGKLTYRQGTAETLAALWIALKGQGGTEK